ncbi:MAG: carboxypeptidase-like regulatory domain-containing protein, partial [Flavobacterium sp.]|nr:carboxypeptidase-like regulatory domain-containing protein [Flavobacterium sp.]
MKIKGLLFLFLLVVSSVVAQTKVSGVVLDEFNQPIPFANVYFKNSSEGLITNENGRFYLESKQNHTTLVVSFIGFTTQELVLTKSVTYDIKFNLASGETLREVVLISGKLSKKNNPAIDILRKIWERKRQN